MANAIPCLKFYSGVKIPIVGLGTWRGSGTPAGSTPVKRIVDNSSSSNLEDIPEKSQTGEVKAAVEAAIDAGYRHIDTALVYGNEDEVGAGIKAKIDGGVVKRKDLFITSKLWNTFHRPDLVEPALKESLRNLGLEYLDLYLMHWPLGYKEGDVLFPRGADNAIQFSDVDYLDTWKAMEALVTSGLVRNIGVSNFNAAQLTRLIDNSTIKPVMNQIECHPYLNQKQLSKFCYNHGILITAYSPLGSPDRPWAKPEDPLLLEEPKLKAMAEKYKKTVAQILIRYQIERLHVVIPKSITKERIIQNADIFNFKLTDDDMDKIDSLNCNGRIVPHTGGAGHKYHPFENDEY